jgi:hypothetical protein
LIFLYCGAKRFGTDPFRRGHGATMNNSETLASTALRHVHSGNARGSATPAFEDIMVRHSVLRDADLPLGSRAHIFLQNTDHSDREMPIVVWKASIADREPLPPVKRRA